VYIHDLYVFEEVAWAITCERIKLFHLNSQLKTELLLINILFTIQLSIHAVNIDVTRKPFASQMVTNTVANAWMDLSAMATNVTVSLVIPSNLKLLIQK